jgi:hypothetical protein
VLALAFPLHPPGRPEKSRAAELDAVAVPICVVQGETDAIRPRPEDVAAVLTGRANASSTPYAVTTPSRRTSTWSPPPHSRGSATSSAAETASSSERRRFEDHVVERQGAQFITVPATGCPGWSADPGDTTGGGHPEGTVGVEPEDPAGGMGS